MINRMGLGGRWRPKSRKLRPKTTESGGGILGEEAANPLTALYCIVLHYTALYCIILHYIASYCIILHHTALYCIILHYIALYCIILHYTALYCIILVMLEARSSRWQGRWTGQWAGSLAQAASSPSAVQAEAPPLHCTFSYTAVVRTWG